jgi:hypothetical protein
MESRLAGDGADGLAAAGPVGSPANENRRCAPGGGANRGPGMGQAGRNRAKGMFAREGEAAALAAAARFERTAPSIPLGRQSPGRCVLTCAYSSMRAQGESIDSMASESVSVRRSIRRSRTASVPRSETPGRRAPDSNSTRGPPRGGCDSPESARVRTGRHKRLGRYGCPCGPGGGRRAHEPGRDSSGSNQPLV